MMKMDIHILFLVLNIKGNTFILFHLVKKKHNLMFFIDALIQFGKVPSNSKFDKKFSSGMSGYFFFQTFFYYFFF